MRYSLLSIISAVLRWIRKHPWWCLIGILILTWSGWIQFKKWQEELRESPQINHDPTVLFKIRGDFPFDQGYQVEIYSEYTTKNEACFKMVYSLGFIPEIRRPMAKYIKSDMVINGNKFTATIFKDTIKHGFCEWELGYVAFEIKNHINEKARAGRVIANAGGNWNEVKHGDLKIKCHLKENDFDCESSGSPDIFGEEYQKFITKSAMNPIPEYLNINFAISEDK